MFWHSKVDVFAVRLFNHLLLTWWANLGWSDPIFHTAARCWWRRFNADDFHIAVSQSKLCDSEFISKQTSADDMLDSYNKVIGTILDSHARFDIITCRNGPSDPWYNGDCRAAKKTLSATDPSLLTSSLKSQNKLAEKRSKSSGWSRSINF